MNIQSCAWYILYCMHVLNYVIRKYTMMLSLHASSTALSASQIVDQMGLLSLHDQNWYIVPTCATNGDGLYEGLEWLTSQHRGKKYDPRKIEYKII